MNDLTRREALQRSAVTAGALLAAAPAAEARADDPPAPQPKPTRPPSTDRDFVLAAGMTPEEADCWALVAQAAGAFFALPELHPMDRGEVASAIHIVQNKILARPTYRRYLELARAAQADREKEKDKKKD